MEKNSMTRRSFFDLTAHALWLPVGVWAFTSCQSAEQKKSEEKPATPVDPCADFSQVTEVDRQARKKLGYVDKSPLPDSHCLNCQLFLPMKSVPCGKCQLFKGPVKNDGYCTYWAPQTNAG